MNEVIIHPFANGIAVVHPVKDSGLSVLEIARKDVPQGVPYRIISTDDLPPDRTFREAWEADFSEPDGYGDPEGWWAEEEARLAAISQQQPNQPTGI